MNTMKITVVMGVLLLIAVAFFWTRHISSSEDSVATQVLDSVQEQVAQLSNPASIPGIRATTITSEPLEIDEELARGSNYRRYLAHYGSGDLRINALLTVPTAPAPEEGYPAILFLHGYIPPTEYKTTERYVAYVDSLAGSGFVVLKIDYRGHGESEGSPSGAYFSPDYVLDSLAALKVLQEFEGVNPVGIGIWGHSMSGNVALRTAVVSDAVQAVVIWGGAVYSYTDFMTYRLNDSSYRPAPQASTRPNRSQELQERFGQITAENQFWKEMAPTNYLGDLSAPVQLHHAENDTVVNSGYSTDLAASLSAAQKEHELYLYPTGGHDIEGGAFTTAMKRTVEFFAKHLTIDATL